MDEHEVTEDGHRDKEKKKRWRKEEAKRGN